MLVVFVCWPEWGVLPDSVSETSNQVYEISLKEATRLTMDKLPDSVSETGDQVYEN